MKLGVLYVFNKHPVYSVQVCIRRGCFCSVDCNRHPEDASERTRQQTIRRGAKVTQKAVEHDHRPSTPFSRTQYGQSVIPSKWAQTLAET
jgi:hypothetical protein